MLALNSSIKRNELTIRKMCAGSITILFSNGKKPLVISEDSDVNLSSLASQDDFKKSNIEWLVKRGFIKLVI